VTELRQHLQEVADVVAAIAQRRLVDRQQPDAVDAQPLEIVELLRQAANVAGAVRVGIVKAADQNFVENRALVPKRVTRLFDAVDDPVVGSTRHDWAARTAKTWAGSMNGSRRT